MISHPETKDGSGGPLDYDDLESEDVMLPRVVESGGIFSEQRQHPSVIEVSNWTHCHHLQSSLVQVKSYLAPTVSLPSYDVH